MNSHFTLLIQTPCNLTYIFMRGRGRQFKKVFLLKMFFKRFWLKTNWSTKHFCFDLNLEQHSSLKVRGSEINFIIQKLLKSKNPCGFVTETFKTGIINPRGFFDSSNFCIIKLISEPLTLRLLCCSRLRSNEKCLVDQLLLGQNLLKNVFNSKTFLNWRPLLFVKIFCNLFFGFPENFYSGQTCRS